MTRCRLMLALSAFTLAAAAGAQDQPAPNPFAEHCGVDVAAPADGRLRWDCAGIAAADVDALEALVQADYTLAVTDGPEFRVYASRQEKPFSAWVFIQGKAVRYRAIETDGAWEGVGVTTYCGDIPAVCAAFETFSAASIPEPLVAALGAPAPEAPPVTR